MDEVISSVSIEYNCECDSELCSHAFDAVKALAQKAYEKGIEDGVKKALAEVRSGLRAALRPQKQGLPPVDKKPKKTLIN